MRKETSDPEYDSLKRFLAWACDNGARSPDATPDAHPMFILAQAEKEGLASRTLLKGGLKEAVGDVLSDFSRWPADRIQAADEALKKLGGPTLSEMIISFSGGLKQIERRGHIKSEEEVYLVRNALEMPMISSNDRRTQKLKQLLFDFEYGNTLDPIK